MCRKGGSSLEFYADVIVDITSGELDRTFQYRIPEPLSDTVQIGSQVVIPFGKGNRRVNGFVVGISTQPKIEAVKIKDIQEVEAGANAIESQLIALAGWMRETCGGTMNQALKTVLPVRKKTAAKEEKLVFLAVSRPEAEKLLEDMKRRHANARARLLTALLEVSPLPASSVSAKLSVDRRTIRALEEAGIVRVESVRTWRNPLERMKQEGTVPRLNAIQRRIIEAIRSRWEAGDNRPSLLFGVTGSGKTEVYMELIAGCIAQGKQAIVLIPEIALTFQTVLRLWHRFGDRVSVLHSKLSAGERSDQFERAKSGELDVVIGPRSALFAPLPDIGVIIIDEEHEPSYKSEKVPCYHARETAIARARLCGAAVVLGSATPAVETYEKALRGEYYLYEMPERVSSRPLPTVWTEDMRQQMRQGNRSILSFRLRSLMEDRLSRGEQIMLFLNRRGMAGFVSCRSCGQVMKCPHCDVSLSLHRGGSLVCHYCGTTRPMVQICPECGSPYIGGFRAGTEKVEEYVKKEFPEARVLRMDFDTTRQKDGHEKILSAFGEGEADILIGTQMIVKGHDFGNVTLVGVLAADLSLGVSDYRASERTFQLLVQAAGRAGRGQRRGEVVIQTYQPDHFAIVTAARQDYKRFYEQEMQFRRLMRYPPVWQMLVIHLASEQEDLVTEAAGLLQRKLTALFGEHPRDVQVIGPADAMVARVKDRWRKVIYIKCPDYGKLVSTKDVLEETWREQPLADSVSLLFDFNPMSGF